jgi:hypothetical protein
MVVNGESGMALPLAIIMIVLLGVMGAGLLTFVSRDLNTVVEQNRGQRAFELADAGVGVAKRQLTSDCAGNTTCIEHYDANMLDGAIQDDTPDIQWSWINGGVTLNDLDDDNVTTVDSVNVTIDYLSDADSLRVISEGTYGNARRKIQAIFKGIQGAASGGGDGLGHPLYYTPSDIKIAKQVELNKMSLFSEQDILLEDNAYDGGADGWEDDRGVFRTDLRFRDQGTTKMAGDVDELCDWNTTTHYFAEKQGANQECFKDITGTWNTQGRLLNGLKGLYPHLADQIKQGKTKMEEGGLAAEGLVCGVPTSAFLLRTAVTRRPQTASPMGCTLTTAPPDPCDSLTARPKLLQEGTTSRSLTKSRWLMKDC